LLGGSALLCCGVRTPTRIFRRAEPRLLFGCAARLLKGVQLDELIRE
jgi:hypothetical protein